MPGLIAQPIAAPQDAAQLAPAPVAAPRTQYNDQLAQGLQPIAAVRQYLPMTGRIAVIPDVTPGIGPDQTPWPRYSPTQTTQLAPNTWENGGCSCP